ncbi:MAG: hypothetical protein NWR72_12755 [Bacteroidia bacterium]|nr:hypothetical protein [Bacteroidia bacterium]
MLKSPVIFKNAPKADSENYELLRQQGRKQIENLASQLWTDYNAHDPGITILEALCYAITDLGYRTKFEIKDLLTRSDKGANFSVGRFHTAADVLSCYPITFDDLRKVILDIRGVRNAWVYPVHKAAYRSEGCDLAMIPAAEALAEWQKRQEAGQVPDSSISFLEGLYEVCIEFEEYVKDMTLGPEDLSGIDAGEGNYLRPEGQGICFRIEQDIVLTAVSVYAADPDPITDASGNVSPGAPVPITISLLNGHHEVIQSWEQLITEPHKKTRLLLDYSLEYDASLCDNDDVANQYCLVAEGPEGCLWLFAHREPDFPFTLPGQVSLTHGMPEEDVYYFFYDWEWDEHESSKGNWHRATLGEPDDTNFLSEYVAPAGQALVFDVEKDLTLDAVHVFVSKPGKVTFLLENDRGKVIRSEEIMVADKLCKMRIPLCWEIPACQNYRLSASAEKGVNLCLSRGAAFPYSVEGVILLLGGTEGGRLQQFYPFFYDWEISWRSGEEGEVDDHDLSKGAVRAEVWRRLHAYRNLCEDPVAVSEIRTEEIGIDARIILAPGADVNSVHAEILCLLEEHIKPSIYFYTLSQLMERKYTVEQIFTGPLLDHGFLDPAEFAAATNRTELRSSDIINLLMDVEGVQNVKNIRLEAYHDGVLVASDPWFLCLAKENCWKPNFTPSRSCFQFLQKNISQKSDSREVSALLEEKRLRLRPVKLKAHETDLPVPVGQDREVLDYWPAQHDLPGIYRAGKFQVPENGAIERKAQSLQLKAFMMFFEQMLANYLAQLDGMQHLFSWEPQPAIRTYFTQPATAEIAEADKLYRDYQSLTTQLDDIIETEIGALERRNRFLDHLTGRFAESFADYSLLMFQLFDGKEEGLKKVIRDKELLLEHYPELSAQRARAYDYRYAPLTLSGFQSRVMALLGMQPRLPNSATLSNLYQLQQHVDGRWRIVIVDAFGDFLFISRYEATQALASGLFDLVKLQGTDADHYHLQLSPDKDCPDGRWDLLGPCEEKATLGYVPGGTESARDQLIDWLSEEQATVSSPAELADHWLDLASDYFSIVQEEDGWRFTVNDGETVLFTSRACQREASAEQILDAAIRLGTDKSAYRFDAKACRWDLLNDCKAGEEAEVLGSTTTATALRQVIDLFQQARSAEGFHVLEHILLRPRSADSPFLTDLPGYPSESRPPIQGLYSFQATVLLPAWPSRSDSLAFRQLTEQTLRKEAPAHVYLHIVWVSYPAMRRFEVAYQAWLMALAALPRQQHGVPPFSPGGDALLAYEAALTKLLHSIECLRSTYPPARLYDPQAKGGQLPMLGKMSLRSM